MLHTASDGFADERQGEIVIVQILIDVVAGTGDKRAGRLLHARFEIRENTASHFIQLDGRGSAVCNLFKGFFSLFVPYNAYGEVSVFSSVELFALPLCYIFLTLIMRNLLLIGSILSIIVALLLSLFPAFIETIGYYSPRLACTILAVYGLICVVLQFSMRKLSSQSKTKQAVAMNNPSV